ncbi:DNA/RNA nuclease SfsA [uncultured Ruthenibacterium sp.]|uniref:DNA/RNA nuclease SfsA n=1 Tax=uncultured Ruthenibacterium sp. TaxID=1905347 RepID=UPI00349ED2EF
MQYKQIQKGVFLDRPGRFIAHVEVDGVVQVCHVKNTGRCQELLLPGATVYVDKAPAGAVRKTLFDLVAVEKGNLLINMDSQAPNRAAEEFLRAGGLFGPPRLVRPETKWGNSRFDFYLETSEDKIFVEVKGVTLEQNGLALFPDAPTQRGIKHLEELIACTAEGYKACALFVIQMKGVNAFAPNEETHPAFAATLRKARDAGVSLFAYDCCVTPASMVLNAPVPILL